MTYFLLFLANFVFIFMKAFQQRNVSGAHYFAILPTSFALAATEVYIIVQVVAKGIDLGAVLALGLAGGLGSMTAVFFHRRIFK